MLMFSSTLFSQDFSSKAEIAENKFEIEVIFEEIQTVEVAEQIIKSVRSIAGVEDIELFYPTTNNGKITADNQLTVDLLVSKLSEIEVKLNQKSFRAE